MTKTKPETGGIMTSTLRILLLVSLVAALIAAYTAFVVLPQEWPERPPAERESLAAYGHLPPGGLAPIPRSSSPSPAELGWTQPGWRVMAHIENGHSPAPDVVITATDLDDALVPVENFSAQIVLRGDETQVLPGVGFIAEKPGRYVARAVPLPDNGEWEIRATLRRGHQTMLLGQRIAPLLPESRADTAGDTP